MHVIDSDAHVGRYLTAQPQLNTSLEYNRDSGVLFDASLSGKKHARTALIAGVGMSRAMASKYAQFVGPGMLSGLMVAPRNVEHDKNKAPGISMGMQLRFMSDALRLANKHTEMAWVGPTKVDVDQSVAVPRLHGTSMLEVNDGPVDTTHGAEVSVILPMKICGALAAMGYDSTTVHNVGKLVRNNMMSIDAPIQDKALGFPNIPEVVEKMLYKIFMPCGGHVRNVDFNSNEPVVLINDFGRCGGVKLGAIVSEVLEQMQRNNNTWPVRVYAGNFIEGDDPNGPEFSITVLNVVNTDIGGPSMIQLLDHPCNTLGWNGCMRREVWNGRDLLERFEKPEEVEEKKSVIIDEPAEEEEDHFDEEVVESEDPPSFYDAPDDNPVPVYHPTWEHSTKVESLIDMVANQAITDEPGAQPGDSPKSEAGSLDRADEKKRRTDSSSSEGFIVL